MNSAVRFSFDRFETQKQSLVKWACFLWVILGGYFFTELPGAKLYSLAALGYFTIGLVLAAVVFGGGTWLAGFVLAALSARLSFDTGRSRTWLVTAVGALLLAAEAYVMFLAAGFVVSSII